MMNSKYWRKITFTIKVSFKLTLTIVRKSWDWQIRERISGSYDANVSENGPLTFDGIIDIHNDIPTLITVINDAMKVRQYFPNWLLYYLTCVYIPYYSKICLLNRYLLILEYLMKLHPEARPVHEIGYLRFYFRYIWHVTICERAKKMI